MTVATSVTRRVPFTIRRNARTEDGCDAGTGERGR
jgi:hypothetical protein